ncbi:MAG TPA: ribonuclease HII [Paenibacillus sp.]|uniref:ribonuclease HII n=1 Tax=Paenibacillus sp. TaxID=58172 RepID=UPI0028D1B299|nr:ribonuclease HII [Paenibacillus sp.]HUC90995.1 ribonuclease HII [Paenibacillus sp.]
MLRAAGQDAWCRQVCGEVRRMGRKRKAGGSTEPRIVDLLAFERSLWLQGYGAIAGVDEVGRGCLFGDVVAAAVVLPPGLVLEGVDDSKKLTEKKREQCYEMIMAEAVAWSVARVDSAEIDRINIRQASRLAMRLAVAGLSPLPDYLLVDAEKIELDIPQLAVIHGDARSQSIAAASIVAKVTRDRLCAEEWDPLYPEYGIAIHKGYATRLHRDKLLAFGPSPMHRRSFLGKITAEAEQQLLF